MGVCAGTGDCTETRCTQWPKVRTRSLGIRATPARSRFGRKTGSAYRTNQGRTSKGND